jgi:hypothetical protein
MWLGPDLLGRLERQRLDEVAVVTEHGHGVRLQVRPESSLDELESALAPVLPGASDWKAGVDRYYGR